MIFGRQHLLVADSGWLPSIVANFLGWAFVLAQKLPAKVINWLYLQVPLVTIYTILGMLPVSLNSLLEMGWQYSLGISQGIRKNILFV